MKWQRIYHSSSYLRSTGLRLVWPWAFLYASECETGFRWAVLFSEQLCVHSSGRELLWPSVLLSVLRIGSRVQRTSRLWVSLPASLSPPPTLLFSLYMVQKYIWSIYHLNTYEKKKSRYDVPTWKIHLVWLLMHFVSAIWVVSWNLQHVIFIYFKPYVQNNIRDMFFSILCLRPSLPHHSVPSLFISLVFLCFLDSLCLLFSSPPPCVH